MDSLAKLVSWFSGNGDRALVALSGGVDSAVVALAARKALGKGAVAVTADYKTLSSEELATAKLVAQEIGISHNVIHYDELENPDYQANNANRCFFCKDELYSKLESVAHARGIQHIVDGSTTDDLNDYRPGRQAATQHAVRSPLIEVELSKSEVRELSRKAELPTWDKPASPCLSSRIAYGTTVTIERLSKVDRGEEILREFGFREFRVRHHDQLVRLEIAQSEMDRVLRKETIDELARRFRELGFKYVTLDLQGFRSGSMNEALPVQIKRD